MKDGTLMRILFCKIHCPFICFCKPSAAHLYTSAPLKLETSPHVVDESSSGVEEEVMKAQTLLKSCIRKPGDEEAGMKRVQWMDNVGKQLAEIKEFESSETGDTDNEEIQLSLLKLKTSILCKTKKL